MKVLYLRVNSALVQRLPAAGKSKFTVYYSVIALFIITLHLGRKVDIHGCCEKCGGKLWIDISVEGRCVLVTVVCHLRSIDRSTLNLVNFTFNIALGFGCPSLLEDPFGRDTNCSVGSCHTMVPPFVLVHRGCVPVGQKRVFPWVGPLVNCELPCQC